MFDKSKIKTIIIFLVFIVLVIISQIFTDVNFLGDKTESIFDFWSFQHFFSGIILGFLIEKIKIKKELLFVIVIAYFWELIEVFLEIQTSSIWLKVFMSGVEHPLNRFLADPIMLIFGYIAYKAYPKILLIAILITIIFLAINISLGDSMALQGLLKN